MSMRKYALQFLFAAAAVGLSLSPALAGYPDHPITIVVPYTPGGTVDLLARALGREMSQSLGQQVIIDNRPGAGGSVGAEYVAKAASDGYTLLMSTNSPLTTNLALYPSLRYDTLRDFTPIVLTGENGLVVVANPALPVKSFADLIALAKKQPGALAAGTSGNGTTAHISLAQINKRAGVQITHVPYNGGVPSLTAAMSGEVQITLTDIVPALPLVRDARLKVLATTSEHRPQVAPEIPTIAESGYPGFNIVAWNGLLAPKGVPAEVVRLLNAQINHILETPEVRKQIISIGIDPLGGTAEAFTSLLKEDIPRWRAMVIDAGVKLE
ncbi:MAG TPA: tripartite tricarboxylate transporter substrate binding protein [Xanthobacteraceae bacterium]